MIEKTFETPGPLTLNRGLLMGGNTSMNAAGGLSVQTTSTITNNATFTLQNGSVTCTSCTTASFANISIGDLHFGGREWRLRVTCPAGAELKTSTAAANLTARGRYSAADVKTASGDVTIDVIDGDARIKSVSGDVAIESVGGDLDLKTVSGDVEVGHVGGNTTARTVSGDLRLRDTESSVTANSVSGDVRLQVASGDVGLTSVSGDMEVAIRRGSRVYIDANSVSGELDSELELAESPTGGEGPIVELRAKAVSGDFRVVRA